MVKVHDGVAEPTPKALAMLNPARNHVVIRCDAGFVFMAHFKTGSIALRQNQQVAIGQFAGLLRQ